MENLVKERIQNGELIRLSTMELQFMRFIWKHPNGVSSEAIYEYFPQARGTKSTVLYNISEKGYVEKVQQGLHHFYRALVNEAEYDQAVLLLDMEKNFGDSSFERLTAAFCGKTKLDEEQKDRIKSLIEELKNDLDSQ